MFEKTRTCNLTHILDSFLSSLIPT